MQFDLRRFIASDRAGWQQTFDCDLSGRDFAGSRIETPVQARFTAQADGDEVRMTLRASASVHGECARCLDPVSFDARVEAEWTARERDLDDPDFELPLTPAGSIDLDDWLYQEFLFQIPGVLLCSPDCPGLCPQCGRKRPCSCPAAPESSVQPDARLSVLKSLLN